MELGRETEIWATSNACLPCPFESAYDAVSTSVEGNAVRASAPQLAYEAGRSWELAIDSFQQAVCFQASTLIANIRQANEPVLYREDEDTKDAKIMEVRLARSRSRVNVPEASWPGRCEKRDPASGT